MSLPRQEERDEAVVSARRRPAPRPSTARWLLATVSAALVLAMMSAVSDAQAAPVDAPGAPGAAATWTTGDKDGLGTSISTDSKVWYTLTGGTMSEVYYPSGDTPNVRSLDFVVTDGSTFTQQETDTSVTRAVSLVDPKSLTYQQTSTDTQGRWTLTKTYVTDPARSSVLINVRFQNFVAAPITCTRCMTRRWPRTPATTPVQGSARR